MEVKIGEKTYKLQCTRKSICQTEEAFGISLLVREEPKTYTETMKLLKAYLYAVLIKNQPKIKVDDMDEIYDIFTGEDGFEQDALLEGLLGMIGEAISPTGGKRRKKLK